jgi:hypothetical protein
MTTNPTQDDALTFQANQIPDDQSSEPDGPDDAEDRAKNMGRTERHDHHNKARFDYPRYAEQPDVKAPTRPVLRVPEDPKSLNGKRLTPPTLARDRDMLESRKAR